MAGKSISSQPHPNSDSPETFEYKGMVVCVAPGGDTYDVVYNNCRYFKSKNCDVAITATRCKGGSVDALHSYEREVGAKIEWVAKSYEYNLSEATQILCNQEIAQLILEMI